MKPENERKAGMYDFDGACAPKHGSYSGQATFSVGIFQWIPKASGKGLKRSAVIKRIRGLVRDPEDVYRRAQAECDKLSANSLSAK